MKKLLVLGAGLAVVMATTSAVKIDTEKSFTATEIVKIEPTPSPEVIGGEVVGSQAQQALKLVTTPTQVTPKVTPNKNPQPPKNIDLYPVTALYSQKTIDRGKLVTWMTSPTCLLAGHDTRGWQWLDDIKTGTVVNVKTGPCSGTYKVVGHQWQSVKGGPVPGWMSNYALVLQTCTGKSGMGFSVAQRM